TFKAEIAIEEAGKDPVKKATVIREIVESIAKIPDSIKRAVFFQQCSQMLNISEEILIAEFNKIQLKSRKKPEFENPFDPGFEPESITQTAPVKQKDLILSAVEMQEKEIVRLLLKYGNEAIDTNNFAHYILSEIEDIEFTIPIYKLILDLIKEDFRKLGVIRESLFTSNPDAEIRNESIALITSRYSISEKWARYEIIVPKDEELLSNIGYLIIMRLKFRSIKFLVKENMLELKKAEENKEDIIP